MKKLTVFKLKYCGYCRRALQYIEDCLQEHPEYKSLVIEQIDEREQYQLAKQYDYFYVPTFYIDNEKVHEGAISYDQVKKIIKRAYEA